MLGVLKFSGVMSISAAAAMSPTTVGRKSENMVSTKSVSRYFMRILVMVNISMNEGKTTANVAIALPNTPMAGEYPALTTAD